MSEEYEIEYADRPYLLQETLDWGIRHELVVPVKISEDSGYWIAVGSEGTGVATQGDTPVKTIQGFLDGMSLMLECCLEDGSIWQYLEAAEVKFPPEFTNRKLLKYGAMNTAKYSFVGKKVYVTFYSKEG